MNRRCKQREVVKVSYNKSNGFLRSRLHFPSEENMKQVDFINKEELNEGRIQDTGVLLDCLPVLTNNLQTEASSLSLGCCVDLMPQVKVILSSKYEEHITVGLHWVQSVVRKWWPELSKAEKRLRGSCSEDRNMDVMKQRLKDLWKEGSRLCLVPGSVGELAKAVEAHLSQLS